MTTSTPKMSGLRRSISDGQKLDLKNERCVGRNCARKPSLSVRQFWGYRQPGLIAHFHRSDSLVPALYDLASPQDKGERLVAVNGTIELCPVRQPAGIVDRNGI